MVFFVLQKYCRSAHLIFIPVGCLPHDLVKNDFHNQTDGQQCDPIRVAVVYFELRNPKNTVPQFKYYGGIEGFN